VLLLIALSCGGPALIYEKDLGDYDYVVAQADSSVAITLPQLYDSLKNSDILPLGGVLAPSDAKLFLDSLLCDTLAGLAANNVKLDDYYDEYRLYRLRYDNAMIRAYLDQTVYSKVHFDSVDVYEFFHSHPEIYDINEQVLLYHILISPLGRKMGKDSLYYRALSPEQFEIETAEYAQQIRRLIDLGVPFTEVAREYSDDTFQGQQGGYVGWTERGVYRDPFDSIAFSLKEGEVSQPYQDADGWHIIMVARHMPAGLPPYDSIAYQVATQDLRNTLANKIGGRLIDSLNNLPRNYVYNEAILDTNVYLVDRQVWAAIINGTDTIDFYTLRTFEETWRDNNRVDNTTVAMKKEMIAELAKKIIMLQAARATRCDTLPDVRATEAQYYHYYAKRVYEKDRYDPAWQPETSAVRRYYDDHIDEYSVEKPLEIQQIVAEDSSFAEFLRDQAMAGVDFLELAEEYYPGEPEIRRQLADLGRVGPGDVPDVLYKAALLTPVGDVSHPVKTEYGYHIIKVVSRQETLDLSKASLQIVPILKRRHALEVFARFRDRLYKQYHVKFPYKLRPLHLKPLDYRSP